MVLCKSCRLSSFLFILSLLLWVISYHLPLSSWLLPSGLLLKLSTEFCILIVVFFSSKMCLVLFYVFSLSLLNSFCSCGFSEFVKLLVFSCNSLSTFQNNYFEFFIRQFMSLHSFGGQLLDVSGAALVFPSSL